MVRLRLTDAQREQALELFKKSLAECNIAKDFTFKLNFKEEIKDAVKPIIKIPSDIYCMMYELVKQSPIEISWHGLIHKQDNVYTIYDILVFPQTNTATTTTTDDEEYAGWMMNLMMDNDFPFNDLRMHGHSHVNMQVFSSGTDDKYQEDMVKNISDGDYYMFLILNKKHEICPIIYDFEQQIMFKEKDIKIEITDELQNDIVAWAKDAIKTNCKTAKPKAKSTYYGGYSPLPIDDEDINFGYIDRNRKLKKGKK